MSLLLAPVQGTGLKIKRYRIYNQQIDIVNNSSSSSVGPIVINDTTAVNTTANAYTQVKSYNISIPYNDWGHRVVNAVRVQIYGYVSAGTGYVEVLINGAAPAMLKTIVGTGNSNSFTNTTSALIFDGIISLPSTLSSPYTLSINAYNATAGDTTYIADVYGFQGLAITSTSPITIDQTETTPLNTILDEIGLSYQLSGAKLIAYVNRYTTANANIQIQDQWNTNQSFSIPAANDAANTGIVEPEALLDYGATIPSGYNGGMTFTASANVGATGDIIIIGYCFVAFGFHIITFPKGPHYGFIEVAYWVWQIASLAIYDPQYSTGSITGASGWGYLNTIFNVNNSGNWIINNNATPFAIDEDEILMTAASNNVIYRELLLVILE